MEKSTRKSKYPKSCNKKKKVTITGIVTVNVGIYVMGCENRWYGY